MKSKREHPRESGGITDGVRRLLRAAASPCPERYAAFVRLRTFGRATTARPTQPAPRNDHGMPDKTLRPPNAAVRPPPNGRRPPAGARWSRLIITSYCGFSRSRHILEAHVETRRHDTVNERDGALPEFQ